MRRIALFLSLLTAATSAQQPSPPPPSFGSSVEVVAVDVTVVDPNGRPIPDLKPGDFTLKVDGKPRTVMSAEFVKMTGESEAAGPPPLPYFSSNERSAPGRLVLIAVNEASIPAGSGRDAIRSATRLLDRLQPTDRVGLLTLPGPDPRVEFTTDHQKVADVLPKLVGRAPMRLTHRITLSEALAYVEQDNGELWATAKARECGGGDGGSGGATRSSGAGTATCLIELETAAQEMATTYQQQSRQVNDTLSGLFEALKSAEGPKIVVLISGGFGQSDTGSRIGAIGPALRKLSAEASAARVSLYSVQVNVGTTIDASSNLSATDADTDQQLQSVGLDSLAYLTKGTVFRGDPDRAFDRIVREISGYYLLGFQPDANDRDGKPHDVDVKVTRAGATVRARRATPFPTSDDPKAEEQALVASLKLPVQAAAVPVRVASYALAGPTDDKIRVLISAEIGRGSAPQGVAVAYVLFDDKKRVVASAVQRARADAENASGALPFLASVVVPPGEYTLRLAARDHAGREGIVDHTVKAALTTASGLAWSDLLLARPPAPGKGVQPGLGLDNASGTLVAQLELAVPPEETAVSVGFEIARDATSPALRAIPARVVKASAPGRLAAQGAIPLAQLPPGDYVVRAVIARGGAPVGSAIHAFRVADAH